MKNTDSTKKSWATPVLTVHGDVAAITQNRYKTVGSRDGIILVPNTPLMDVPSPS